MTDVLLSPEPNTTGHSSINQSSNSTPSSKKRLNWLSWMRKSLHIGRHQRNTLCSCGLHHVSDSENTTKSAKNSSAATDWPVFTTQMSQSGKSKLVIYSKQN